MSARCAKGGRAMSVDLACERCSVCDRTLAEHRDGTRQVSCAELAASTARPAPTSPWMTAEQCAAYLQYSVDTAADTKRAVNAVYQLVRRSGLPASRRGPTRRLMFHRQHVNYWLEHGTDVRAERHLRLAARASR
jgi:hypothetical protein